MRIANDGPQGVGGPVQRYPALQRPSEGSTATGSAHIDSVELSPEAQLIQRLQRELAALPENPGRTEAVKQAIDAGEYRVPAALVAQRMLARGFNRQ